MGIFINDLVSKIYSLPKTKGAVSEFLNSYYDEVSPDGKVTRRQMWERFEGAYVKVTRHYAEGTDDDRADIYLYAHKLISRCVLADVSPYFESDGQLFSYFQLMVRNTKINNSVKAKKDSFLLIDDLIDDSHSSTEKSNFNDVVLSSGDVSVDGFYDSVCSVESDEADKYINILSVIDNLTDDCGKVDNDLVLFGRLFINNNFSYDGMYGLCGFDLKKFKCVKKRFINALKKRYENEM